MEWQNVLYCVQSSRLSSEEVSSREERIGEEVIHDGMKERRKKEKKKKLLGPGLDETYALYPLG